MAEPSDGLIFGGTLIIPNGRVSAFLIAAFY
jgi:hypothetical protein